MVTRTLKVLRKQQLELAANHPGLFALVWLINLGKTKLPKKYVRAHLFPNQTLDDKLQLGVELGYFTYKLSKLDIIFEVKEVFIHSIREKVPDKIQDRYKALFNNSEFVAAWENWSIVRRSKKSAMTPRSDNQHLKQLCSLSGGAISVMIKMVDEAANGGWTKLYKLSYAVESSNKDVKSGGMRPPPKV